MNPKKLREYALMFFVLGLWTMVLASVPDGRPAHASNAPDSPKLPTTMLSKPTMPKDPIEVKAPQPERIMTLTCFSGAECRSAWCKKNHATKGNLIAVPARYGKYTTVYVEEYQKTYSIIHGAPSSGTDLDVWKGMDQQAAQECGSHQVHVKFQ